MSAALCLADLGCDIRCPSLGRIYSNRSEDALNSARLRKNGAIGCEPIAPREPSGWATRRRCLERGPSSAERQAEMSKLTPERRAKVVEHLLDGCGIRPTARLCEVDKKTALLLHEAVGRGSIALHNHYVRGVDATHLDLDEMHSFVKKRQKHVVRGDSPDIGEQWVWLALTRGSKLVLSYYVSKRDQASANAFMLDVRSRLTTIPVLSTDAWPGYPRAVGEAFCSPITSDGQEMPPGGVDYGQIVKSFSGRRRDYDKTAPADGPPRVAKRVIWGAPDLGEIGTSYSERENLNLRTHLRRLVRRGIGHSKTFEGHLYAIASFVFWRNFCLPHGALNGRTPAQTAGLAEKRWTTLEFVEAALEADECAPPEPVALQARVGAEGASRRTGTGTLLRAVPKTPSKPGVVPPAGGPGVVKVGATSSATSAAEPPHEAQLSVVQPEPQGDLFAWATSRAATVAQSEPDPWEELEAQLPALPPIGTQLSLFGATPQGGAS